MKYLNIKKALSVRQDCCYCLNGIGKGLVDVFIMNFNYNSNNFEDNMLTYSFR